jgi:uncharacterized surface protein with fasciclin (FAS1) repeats
MQVPDSGNEHSTLEVIMKRLTVLGVAAVLASIPVMAGAHCGSCESHAAKKADIVATASSAGSFDTLVAAVEAADLVETLQSDGPFTVFAPTDEAFAKLPEGTVESLLANPDQLREVLLYHVVPGKVMAADVVSLNSATTAQGSEVAINAADGNVRINDALVTATDIETSNGVIHVIDTVIIPRG